MPARQVHVVLAIAASPFSLSTGTNAGLHNTKEVKALQQEPCQCQFDAGPFDGDRGTKADRPTADYIRVHVGRPDSRDRR